jgi:hypothetical protein
MVLGVTTETKIEIEHGVYRHVEGCQIRGDMLQVETPEEERDVKRSQRCGLDRRLKDPKNTLFTILDEDPPSEIQ